MTKLLDRIPTPCIGVCSTAISDEVCRGCKRFAHEVIAWNSYTETEKQAVEARLDQLLSQIVGAKLTVFDVALLRQQLEIQRVRYRPNRSPLCWVFELLRAGAGQIQDTRLFGFEVHPGFRALPLVELREMIDQEFFILSNAHYERYVRPL
ncbi:MAG: DUF1289 domain-containing protein [Spongiibacteraceae bacterium]|nr:DUF1289 domain-containing protein [Spongiibacteraceae bacterium]